MTNKLDLKPTKKDNILKGKRKDGTEYSVRKDRRRYFFPHEWRKFIKKVPKKKHKLFFLTCLHTGGRAMEVLNLKHKDIDVKRKTVNFSVVKQKAKKKHSSGKTRSFFVSKKLIKYYKSHIRGKKVGKEAYIFLSNDKLPDDYDDLNNKEKRKHWISSYQSYYQMLKMYLKRAGIKDPHNFSLHNIRKTYGMWMRTYEKEMAEICYRMGHDLNTFMAHYGSSLIFTPEEKREIRDIMGEVK